MQQTCKTLLSNKDLLLALDRPVGILSKAPEAGTGTGKRDGVLGGREKGLLETRMEFAKNAEKEQRDFNTSVVSFDIHKEKLACLELRN